jgi:glycosyltransferase involved in cell wall biosynthesis
MKKVLMIAHQFPPIGGSGVQRTVKFVKYLRDFGWEPVVLTRKAHKAILKDESLINDIPEKIKVVRTNPWDFQELPGILKLFGKIISRKLLYPDGERIWQYFSRRAAVKEMEKEKYDIIYSTSYPYSDHLLALYLKKKYPHIPWVADFRDEWNTNPFIIAFNYNKLRKNIEQRMEKQILDKADSLIANTPIMLEHFIKNDLSLRKKFIVLPNGYDEADFEGLSYEKPSNERFTITFSGLLYGNSTPDNIFEAVQNLVTEKKIDKKKILIKFIGNYKANFMEQLIEKYKLEGIVEVLPYMKHKDSIKQLVLSNAVLLILGEGKESVYTGKIFEYMSCGRPIIATIPVNGAAASLINETDTGYVSDCNDISKTKENVLTLYNQWHENNSTFSPKLELIKKFERKALTKRLSETFENALKG